MKNYKAKLFYEQKQKEHFEKFGVYFDTNCKIGEIIQEFHEQEIKECNTLYEFLYNDCIHESVAATMSIHRTQKGAEMAMEFHKNEKQKEFDEFNKQLKEYGRPIMTDFGKHEWWGIRPVKLLD